MFPFFHFKNFKDEPPGIAPIFLLNTCSVHTTGLTGKAGLGNLERPIPKIVIPAKRMITRLVISIPLRKGRER